MIKSNMVIGAWIVANFIPKDDDEFSGPLMHGGEMVHSLNRKSTNLQLAPFFEILFRTGTRVVPFVQLAAGIGMDYQKSDESTNITSSPTRIDAIKQRSIFAIGHVRGGIHLFFISRCAISFSVGGHFTKGKSKWEPNMDDAVELDTQQLRVDFAMGVSAWI
ncbi:MAG: hypothetical protein JXR76_08495 [Deltaproteobacteria bacterium]|nr:hypothetical protein [Deltaproteobacteria bacterium]